ncbi:MAG TPA: hypothetical protein VLR71_03440 [Casimicrobiaceae bacterium]|nr:hypothetical protein [Casimicrobiaceae bacterium]
MNVNPFKWFNSEASVAFAAEIAREVQVLIPMKGEALKEKDYAKKLKNLERLLRRVHEFSKQHRLNTYQKAKFGNTVRWLLREAGYPKDFVESVIGMMLPIM